MTDQEFADKYQKKSTRTLWCCQSSTRGWTRCPSSFDDLSMVTNWSSSGRTGKLDYQKTFFI